MSAKLPVVVIVGRPNVGKSTLFNRLVGRRVAVVEDTPGVTRDRLYGEAEWNGRTFTVVDTGGILFADEDPLIEQIRVQAEVALAEADAVLFLTDLTAGPTPDDWDLANRLRGFKKPVYILVNKADNPQRESLANEFTSLASEKFGQFQVCMAEVSRMCSTVRSESCRKPVTWPKKPMK